jgi:signal transduction histidine kinase
VVDIIQNDISIVSRESNGKLASYEFAQLNLKINEREELKTRLTETQKRIEYANEMRLIAHDIRSPLAIVDYLAQDFQAEKEKAAMLRQAINQINGICDNILKRSKNPETTSSLNDFLQVLIANKKCELKDLDLSLKTNIKSECQINFDEVKIQSILSNFVNNAAEANLDSSKTKVTLRAIQVNDQVIFEVSDNGPGIKEKLRHNIFQKDFTTKKNGNGIGLYEARKYLHSIGGEINFKTSSAGTIFKIKIPNPQERTFESKDAAFIS